MDIHRDAAAIIRDGYRLIGMNGDHHAVTMPGEGLVDGVIHDLEHHMVQAAAVIGIADVHPRPLANRIEAA